MRVGIAGFLHESNTFAGALTEVRHFEEAFLHRGADLLPVWREAHHELGGFIEGCEREGLEMAPLFAASATPKGPLTAAAYDALAGELVSAVASAGPLDGLLLALHGAMVSEEHDSADSETLRRVRAAVGPGLPLILSLDMHANITQTMAELPTATVAYRTYPHVDQRERGIECARLLARALRGEERPVQAHRKLPLLIHIVQQYTGAGVMAELYAEADRVAAKRGILSVSVAPGYIYADVPHMGASVIVAADGDRALAEAEAQHLAEFVFARRHTLNAELPGVEEAVRRVAGFEGPVCLMDCGDNIGGGGPGDATILLRALLRRDIAPVLAVLYDPEAAAACGGAGEGATVSLEVGGKTDRRHGAPVSVSGRVRAVSDGVFIEPEPRHGGTRQFDQGRTAVIDTVEGHSIVVNSRRVMPTSLQQLLSLGIDPGAYQAIIVKGVTAPRAAYESVARHTICVDTPGVTQAGPEAFPYRNRPSPLFPLEQEVEWPRGR